MDLKVDPWGGVRVQLKAEDLHGPAEASPWEILAAWTVELGFATQLEDTALLAFQVMSGLAAGGLTPDQWHSLRTLFH